MIASNWILKTLPSVTSWIGAILFLMYVDEISGHARLLEPPSRATMWRFGFNNPIDYNDNERFCGGFYKQHSVNGGKCGLCGDSWDAPVKQYESPGGKFANGVLTRHYSPGQIIQISIQITANHKGHMVFKICPVQDARRDPSQECFDREGNKLKIVGHGDKFEILSSFSWANVSVVLPGGLECAHCIIQWTYTGGNNWGNCGNGLSATGCGPQETFRDCADVSILTSANAAPASAINNHQLNRTVTIESPTSVDTDAPKVPPVRKVKLEEVPDTNRQIMTDGFSPWGYSPNPAINMHWTTPQYAPPGQHFRPCHNYVSVGRWRYYPGMSTWCQNNCRNPGAPFCPEDICGCA